MSLCSIFLLWVCLSDTSAAAAWPVTPPERGIYQARPVLELGTERKLEGLLVQHEHLTGERIILIFRPQDEVDTPRSPTDVIRELSTVWKLDSTRKGNWFMVLLQETPKGDIQPAYGLGVGLSRAQFTVSADFEELQESLNELTHEPHWDQQAQAAARWALRALSSPLLERPEQLPELTPSSPSAILPRSTRNRTPPTKWGVLFIGIGVALAVVLTAYAIVQGVRPEVLLGPQRTVRLSAQNQLLLLAQSTWYRFRGSKTSTSSSNAHLLIHSWENPQ